MKNVKQLKPLLNRDGDGGERFQLAADGWYQIAPKGEFPHKAGVVQVVDQLALEAMTNRFKEDSKRATFPGVLIDYEHFSFDDTKESRAAGWITELQNRNDGLWGKVRWSESGERDLANGEYRFISPVWLPTETEKLSNRRVRVLRLERAALTNDPNIKGMVPLSNRSQKLEDRSQRSEVRGQRSEDRSQNLEPDRLNNQNQRKTKMKSVMAALGLSEDASEQAALSAVTALKNRAEGADQALTPLKNRVSELETANKGLLEAQVEQDLAVYANRIAPEKKEQWKKALLANRADTLVLLEGIVPAKAAPKADKNVSAPLHNRASAGTPGSVTEKAADLDGKRNAEVTAYMNRNRVKFEDAWNAMRVEKPELFEATEGN